MQAKGGLHRRLVNRALGCLVVKESNAGLPELPPSLETHTPAREAGNREWGFLCPPNRLCTGYFLACKTPPGRPSQVPRPGTRAPLQGLLLRLYFRSLPASCSGSTWRGPVFGPCRSVAAQDQSPPTARYRQKRCAQDVSDGDLDTQPLGPGMSGAWSSRPLFDRGTLASSSATAVTSPVSECILLVRVSL